MPKEMFGVAVDEEIVKTVLIAFIHSDSGQAKQLREIIIRKRKGTL